MEIKDYQSACLDFLNGHMLIKDSEEFEYELKHNQDLADELAEVKQWQLHLQTKQQEDIVPNFDDFESQLTKSQWGNKQSWGYSLVAATSLMFLIYMGTGSEQHITNNKFETLTSPSTSYAKPVAQIVLANNVNIEQFIEEYGLTIIEKNSNSQIITVILAADFEEDFLSLSADSRTIFAKKIEKLP
jgi:hypothetical protein